MIFRQFSALRILKGRLECLVRKCLFSDTRTSAPTHSAYAAMKASASFKPILSYFTPNSYGTRKSSSIEVNVLIKAINSRKYRGVKFRFTSSNIVRGIRTICNSLASISLSSNFNEASAFAGPKANIYSLESMTSRKFFFPYFFPCFAKLFDNIFLTHLKNRGRVFSNHLSEFVQMFLGFFGIRLDHYYHLNYIFQFKHKTAFLSTPV